MPSLWVLVALGGATSFLGAVGGIGGATLLVPVLLLLDVDVFEAAPLGLLCVAATSLAASVRQLDDGLVHHRLGLTIESAASIGAVAGALAAASVSEDWLARVLGLGALVGAVATLARRGVRNLPSSAFVDDSPGEWPGTLGGTYHHEGGSVPYQAKRVPGALAVSGVAGVISGMAGVGGGFLKTPAMSEIMTVPVKVAAATSTFTMGITAAAGLAVFAGQDRIQVVPGAAVVIGALVGALGGARAQSRLRADRARIVTGSLLAIVAIVVLGRTL
ncbi:MAG: sulfite exporter TauE/SafE family protein [Microthrixaceae bacterium]